MHEGTTVRARFDAKHTPDENGCWIWGGGLTFQGYGRIFVAGARRGAHRVSWELHRGAIPESMCVYHRCDVRACVNPGHLWIGSDDTPRVYTRRPLRERFNKRWAPDENGCWIWTAGTDADGYGKLWISRRSMVDGRVVYGHNEPAHRISWRLANGGVPSGLCVCHRCDVPACVNPDHLFLGTSGDNTADKVAKGRQTRGETNGRALVTAADVREIRRRYHQETQQSLADEFGVGLGAIGRIVRCETWRHID